MGDGSLVEMTRSEIKADLEDGTEQAAKRCKSPTITEDEIEHLLDIYASPARFTAVDIGDEVILSNDGTGTKHIGNRVQDLQSFETLLGVDMVELWQIDYSYKAIKTNVAHEAQTMKIAQALLTNPVQYGAMPDLGRYSKPDGPIPNWSELLPLGKIDEARTAQEEAVEMLIEDISFVADGMVAAGTDGIDFDTTGAACTASSSSTASASPACGPRTRCAWCSRPAPASTGRPSTSTPGAPRRGTSPAPSRSSSPPWRSPRSPCTSTWAWASAACRLASIRRPTPRAAPPRPSSRSSRSTGTRWVRAMPSAWRGRTRKRP